MNEDIFSITFFSLIFLLISRLPDVACLFCTLVSSLIISDQFGIFQKFQWSPTYYGNKKLIENFFLQTLDFFWTREQNCDLLHFVGFFHVASLFSIRVDNEKALEMDNRIIFSYFSLISIYKYHPKMQQNILLHSGMIKPNILV